MFFKKSQNGKNKNQKYKKSTLNAKREREREKLHIQQYIYTMAVRADTLINNYL